MALGNVKVFEGLGKTASKALVFFQINKPAVMSGLAMGGAIILTGASAQAAVETYKIKDDIEDLEFVDKAKAVVPIWVEVALLLIFIEIMIFGANAENAKRLAEITAAYSLTQKDLKEYREKAEEIVGSKKAREIEHSIAGDYAAKEGDLSNAYIIDTGKGKTLFKELSTGQRFLSDRNYLEAVVNELNADLNEHGSAGSNPSLYFITKNEFFEAIGLDMVDAGDEMGWNSYDGNLISLEITPHDLPYNQGVIHYIRLVNIGPTFNDEYEYFQK